MADRLSPAQRSKVMSSIKGKDTKAELAVRRFLFRQGLRYRTNDRRLAGRPDIVLPKYRSVIFVNGCFWHGHAGCPLFVLPKTNSLFWKEKIEKNRIRDDRSVSTLVAEGWRVFVVWECELKGRSVREATLQGLVNEIWALD
ncbi:DNA mismatch endonuclease Vsr [Sphaerochaeta sp. PS]|uniref:very short patch repair endonuclease n=1 Tax=Sphaerochaeta sp. PS TaxID=3076336 RepID=UPI0028A3096D|nr:DNA mismatch endonuclease Vsr [Sphaerochaeta sp. PS]MDT4762287.1 DNA mismatch endonuclease Vsr [Sphaerochaeta sp. PS]